MNARTLQWVLLPVIFMGLVADRFREEWAHLAFGTVAFLALGCGLVLHARRLGDLFNPLTILLGVGFLKFSVPFFTYLALGPNAPCFDFYARLGVLKPDLMHRGHTVALLGLCGLLFGWSSGRAATDAAYAPAENRDWTIALRAAALMLAGATALLFFVGRNTDFGTALATGQFRTTQIEAGTGMFFYIAFALIAGSVTFACYLLQLRAVPAAAAFVPVLVAMALYFITGGRTRAITPVIAAVIGLYYARLGHRVSPRVVLGGVLLGGAIPAFYYLGSAFRGGAGLSLFTEGVTESTSPPGEYLVGFFAAELGQLSSLAGAVAIGEGVLGGLSFTTLLFPLNMMLHIPGRSCGMFLAEELMNLPSAHLAALHSTLIGDAYLNFGLVGMVLVLGLAGFALKSLYAWFREGRVPLACLCLATIYAVRVFGEEINKWPEMMIVLTCAWLATANLRALLRRPAAGCVPV
jgi:hypothetical protein